MTHILKCAFIAAAFALIFESFFIGMLVFFVLMFNLGIAAFGGYFLNRIDAMKIDNDAKKAKRKQLNDWGI